MNGIKHPKLIEAAWRRLVAARPSSGFQPKTPSDWKRLLAAHEFMGYASYRAMGMSINDAKSLARLTHGGAVGLTLLKSAFNEGEK